MRHSVTGATALLLLAACKPQPLPEGVCAAEFAKEPMDLTPRALIDGKGFNSAARDATFFYQDDVLMGVFNSMYTLELAGKTENDGEFIYLAEDLLGTSTWAGLLSYPTDTSANGFASMALSGDIDKDGDEDVVYGTEFFPGPFNTASDVQVFPADGLESIWSLSDFDGDGDDEVVAVGPSWSESLPYWYIKIYDTMPDAGKGPVAEWKFQGISRQAPSPFFGGDLDGDGTADLYVSFPDRPSYIVWGPLELGFHDYSERVLDLQPEPNSPTLWPAGDINSDHIGDLWSFREYPTTDELGHDGEMLFHFGPFDGPPDTTSWDARIRSTEGQLHMEFADFNGDGVSDILVGGSIWFGPFDGDASIFEPDLELFSFDPKVDEATFREDLNGDRCHDVTWYHEVDTGPKGPPDLSLSAIFGDSRVD